MSGYYPELIEGILKRRPDKDELSRLKNRLCAKYGMDSSPTDIQVLMHAEPEQMPLLEKFLITKPTRSLSGVAVVAVMTKPIGCPHGKCSMCPGGPGSDFDSPQSYTGHEPATLRGIRNRYDPYLQVFNRLEQYVVTGHVPQKIELIVMGGTFPSFPAVYQDEFMRYSFKAMNDFSDMFFADGKLDLMGFRRFFHLPGSVGDEKRIKAIHGSLLKMKKDCVLSEEQGRNETADVRCVAMCIETRPDYCYGEEIDRILSQGATRVELGVQSLYDDVLDKVKRGHGVEETIKATELLKDSFLKVGYHMMPGLPGSDIDRDLEMFRELFADPSFMPDALKIYPCMVMEGTELHSDWKAGRFMAMTTDEAARLIAAVKEDLPAFCRLMRVQRDIPTKVISAGVDRTNLRQYVDEHGVQCRCIRCREAGHVQKRTGKVAEEIGLVRLDYEASGGREIFLSAEDSKKDILVGFCRLRIPGDAAFRPEITADSAGVRELHVYGRALGIGDDARDGSFQHEGWGKRLLAEAERIAAEEFDSKKMLVISGVGAREYYRRLGYRCNGVYMAKRI